MNLGEEYIFFIILLIYVSYNIYISSFSFLFSSLFGDILFVFSFWLTLCVCLYILVRLAMSTGLGRVALCSRLFVGPNSIVSQVTCRCPRGIPCMSCICPALVIEPWLLLQCQWEGLIRRLTGCEKWPWIQMVAQGLTPWNRICFSGALVPSESPL